MFHSIKKVRDFWRSDFAEPLKTALDKVRHKKEYFHAKVCKHLVKVMDISLVPDFCDKCRDKKLPLDSRTQTCMGIME